MLRIPLSLSAQMVPKKLQRAGNIRWPMQSTVTTLPSSTDKKIEENSTALRKGTTVPSFPMSGSMLLDVYFNFSPPPLGELSRAPSPFPPSPLNSSNRRKAEYLVIQKHFLFSSTNHSKIAAGETHETATGSKEYQRVNMYVGAPHGCKLLASAENGQRLGCTSLL